MFKNKKFVCNDIIFELINRTLRVIEYRGKYKMETFLFRIYRLSNSYLVKLLNAILNTTGYHTIYHT